MKTILRDLILPVLLLIAGSAIAEEGILNRLLAPGPLMEGHKELEATDCLKCHETGQGIPNSKCLDCHKEIKQVVDAKRGFHGLRNETCISCHVEHKGRDFNSAPVDSNTFDHELTGFSLKGKHSELKCTECHQGKRVKKRVRKNEPQYFGAASTCVSCHKKDDVHFFQGKWAKNDCGVCHSPVSWKDKVSFDHKKETGFALLGKHAKVDCAKCHVGVHKGRKVSIYHWSGLKAQQCLTCHKDQHKTKLGKRFRGGRCDECHSNDAWKIESFNHRITGFPLRGEHAKANCIDCHKQSKRMNSRDLKNFSWVGLKTQCLNCHQDYHRFARHKAKKFKDLNKCLVCHDETSWKQTHDFDHERQAGYPITGEHKKLTCNECHIVGAKKYEKVEWQKWPRKLKSQYHWRTLEKKTCNTCHANPHIGKFSKKTLQKKCSECHITAGWKINPSNQKYDHSKTRFPLTGEHTKLNCSECHVVDKKQVFKFKSFEKQFCVDCHKSPHDRQFSDKVNAWSCNECHTTKNFTRLRAFDHGKTRFDLTGAHKKLKCSECHVGTKQLMPSFVLKKNEKKYQHQFLFPEVKAGECIACHTDYHKGQLDPKCGTCHRDTSWKKPKFDHNKQSQFDLKGKHAKIKCSECHKPLPNQFVTFDKRKYKVIHYKPKDTDCLSCHEDHHKGNFGRQCQQCHNESDWKNAKDFHRDFTLTGVHYSLSCRECHINDQRLGGMSNNCYFCHQKDDIHSGQLPNCGECHQQQFWENADFKHSLTSFPLRGAHRTLSCDECHAQGKYTGTSTDCASCHWSQSKVPTSHWADPGLYQTDCSQCHNHFSF